VNDDVRAAIEGRWREVAEIDGALERGEIDEAGWHAALARIIEPAYLGAATPQGQLAELPLDRRTGPGGSQVVSRRADLALAR
jgi:hypothetical protein